jgi:hypothetical protein
MDYSVYPCACLLKMDTDRICEPVGDCLILHVEGEFSEGESGFNLATVSKLASHLEPVAALADRI